MSLFKPASKKQLRSRTAIMGPSGSGKSYTALLMAKALGSKIAVIDTEHGSASKYSGDVASFDVVELTSFAPKGYVEAIEAAAKEGYDVLVIDSLSHAWVGEGGILDQKDKKGGGFQDWKTLTPQHNALIAAILACPLHIIATLRSKTEYVIEKDDRGKNVPRKIGLAPVQRDGLEYEFDLVAEMDMDNTMHVTKSRCPSLSGQSIRQPKGPDVVGKLRAWLDAGTKDNGGAGVNGSAERGGQVGVHLPDPGATHDDVTSPAAPIETKVEYTDEELGRRMSQRISELTHPAAIVSWAKEHAEEITARGEKFAHQMRMIVTKRLSEFEPPTPEDHHGPNGGE